MTEAEWLACADPEAMLKSLPNLDRAADRKLRFFAVASCRCIASFVQNEHLRGVVNTVERYADGQATHREMVSAAKTSDWVGLLSERRDRVLAHAAWYASAMNVWNSWRRRAHTIRIVRYLLAYDRAQAPYQAALLREFFGNPFRPVTVDPGWRRSDVVALARDIYAERAFDRLPILADALQDAGCDSDDLLTHLRGPGPHVRGCWALDLVLGKE